MGTTSGSGKIARYDPAVYREVTELRSLLEQTHKVIDTLEELVRPRGHAWLPWRHHTLRQRVEQARHELEALKLALVKELIITQSTDPDRTHSDGDDR
jgi:hypothetical protein